MNNDVIVTLRNGLAVPELSVKTITATLLTLAANCPAEFYGLVDVCKNEDYQLSEITKERLITKRLIDDNGRPYNKVKTIVLASIEGEGTEIKIVSPYADNRNPLPA